MISRWPGIRQALVHRTMQVSNSVGQSSSRLHLYGREQTGRGHMGPGIESGQRHTIDIFDPEDLASRGVNINDGVSQVGGMSEVGDGPSEQSDGEDVVEHLLAEPGPETQSVVGQEQEAVDGRHRPEPVGALNRELLVPGRRVDLKSVVSSNDDTHFRLPDRKFLLTVLLISIALVGRSTRLV